MIEPNEIKQILKSAGIKHRVMAEKTGVNRIWLSEYLNNRRILDANRLQRIKEYIEKVKTIL